MSPPAKPRPLARSGDFWSGLVLAGLGAYIVSQALGWAYKTEEGPGPGFFPLWYGGAMIVLSLLLVAGAVVKRPADTGPVAWIEVRRALLCWAAFVASIVLMRFVGFMIAFALLTAFMVVVMARKPLKVALPLAIGGAVGFWLLFDKALDVSLPPGLFF